MFCPVCGTKVGDNARFCTGCGAPLDALHQGGFVASAQVNQVESVNPAGPATPVNFGSTVPAPQQPKHSSMLDFLVEKRQIGNRLVPTFALIIASFIAAAGIAYAAFMLYKNVVEPRIQEPVQQEQTAKKNKEQKEASGDDDKEKANKEAHIAYDEVLNQYREAFADGSLTQGYEDNGFSYDDAVESPYWTDCQKDSKYPLFNYFIDVQGTGITVQGMRYLYRDLDGDGVDELLFSFAGDDAGISNPSSYVLAIYTFEDNQAKGLAAVTGYRQSMELCADNVICQWGSSGWAINSWDFSRFVEGHFETETTMSQDCDVETKVATVECSGAINDTASDSFEGISNSADLTNCSALIKKVIDAYPVDTSAAWQPLI
mgnify:FL=1